MVDFKEKVERYKALLIKWNKAINLFSRKLPIEELDLHIRDCEFLAEAMSEEKGKTVLDFGTGNGMPGIVLSIYGFKCILVERNKKKGAFLREAVRELALDALVVDEDITNVYDELKAMSPSVISSKAVAKAEDIISICNPLINKDTEIYLLKNTATLEELGVAKKRYDFNSQIIENKKLGGKVVMKISAVQNKDE